MCCNLMQWIAVAKSKNFKIYQGWVMEFNDLCQYRDLSLLFCGWRTIFTQCSLFRLTPRVRGFTPTAKKYQATRLYTWANLPQFCDPSLVRERELVQCIVCKRLTARLTCVMSVRGLPLLSRNWYLSDVTYWYCAGLGSVQKWMSRHETST